MGFISFFDNFIQIVILLIAWLIVVISFFIMAIQLFVSLIEFKLTTLAGFVLVSFGLFGRTAFLAEKVLGNVFSSGVKVLVLAVIVGIGSTIFGQFTSGFNNPPTIDDALTLILAALALLGLSIFGAGIANGLIAGGHSSAPAPLSGRGWRRRPVAGVAAGCGDRRHRCRRPRDRRRGGAALRPRAAPRRRFRAGGAGGVASAAGTAATESAAPRGSKLARKLRRRAQRGDDGRRPRSNAPRCRVAGLADAPAWANRMKRHQTMQPRRLRRSTTLCAPAIIRAAVPPSTSPKDHERCSDVSTVRYGTTPEPETPYQRAGQAWDERIGSARVQARNWRLAFFGALLMSGGLAAGLVWQSARGTVTPWVVQVDKLGQAQAVAPAVADYRPTDPQIAWHLARFIEEVRRIPADAVVLRNDWLEAYKLRHRSRRAGAERLRPHQRSLQQGRQDPDLGRGRERRPRFRQRVSAWPGWNATTSTTRWPRPSAGAPSSTIVVQPPTDAERLRKNPLGIYVHAFNWSKELG